MLKRTALHKRFRPGTQGFSFIEMLVVLVILGILVAAAAVLTVDWFKTSQRLAARRRVSEIQTALLANLQDDVQTAGLGTKKNGLDDRLIVKDAVSGKPRSAVFCDDQGRLVILRTAQEGIGEVVANSGSALVLIGIQAEQFTQVQRNRMALCFPPPDPVTLTALPPVLVKITDTPRKATESDLGTTDEIYNFDRSAYIPFGAAGSCTGLQSLGTTIPVGSVLVPVTYIARYVPEGDALYREEYQTCPEDSLRPGSGLIAGYNRILLTPFVSTGFKFKYLTTTGASNSFPSDPKTLTGIQCSGKVNEATAQYTEEVTINAYVQAWK